MHIGKGFADLGFLSSLRVHGTLKAIAIIQVSDPERSGAFANAVLRSDRLLWPWSADLL